MDDNVTEREPSPDRQVAVPESYAIHVDDERITVWQYRVDITDPDGDWQFVEHLDRGDDPKLAMDYATLMPPTGNGYWIYSKSYDCELDCD
ncbi:hypothetical protein GJ633_04735 [Halorubrum sp. CBA1125]|uniref:hypothetical protein n=1 Tax=Halorubrum sp. CBA1125 TaxID=2668072 RepID=UPI0012E8B830|nr:hypothetical protein [Halorubrum sp. CBA1125]MUW14042.1 hypothetical protein [Halorubrum sp. CBA1125]